MYSASFWIRFCRKRDREFKWGSWIGNCLLIKGRPREKKLLPWGDQTGWYIFFFQQETNCHSWMKRYKMIEKTTSEREKRKYNRGKQKPPEIKQNKKITNKKISTQQRNKKIKNNFVRISSLQFAKDTIFIFFRHRRVFPKTFVKFYKPLNYRQVFMLIGRSALCRDQLWWR